MKQFKLGQKVKYIGNNKEVDNSSLHIVDFDIDYQGGEVEQKGMIVVQEGDFGFRWSFYPCDLVATGGLRNDKTNTK